jgi:choline dehydrogenase-like flavoprotein
MQDRVEQAEVVVVGAGAAGSVVAATLAERGKQVLVLETGPQWRSRDLYNSPVWSRRLRWGAAPVLTAGTDPFQHQFNIGRGLGGSALHHYGVWPRMSRADFREKSLTGRSVDWPVDYDDLRAFYDRIQADVGISGDAGKEIWRPPGDPYPMPPLATFRHGELLAAGFEKLGMHVAPQPMAINSVPYKGRPSCQYDGWCDSGCSISALANPLAVYWPRALGAGAQLRANATVTRLLTGARPDRVRGVTWRDSQDCCGTIEAKCVVLAANAIQNTRLLLNSSSPGGRHALANASGLLGRFFTYHSNVSIVGEFDVATQNYLGPVAGTLYTRDSFDQSGSSSRLGQSMWHIGASIKPTDVTGMAGWRPELMGAELTDFLEHRAPRMANCIALGEIAARPENRIEISGERDRWDVPVARVSVSLDERDKALLHHLGNTGLAACRAAGARHAWIAGYGNSHAMGGTIMGSDSKRAVVDSYGIAHGIPNLAVVGSSVYPTSGAVNPTYTIHALALRTAERILATWPT